MFEFAATVFLSTFCFKGPPGYDDVLFLLSLSILRDLRSFFIMVWSFRRKKGSYWDFMMSSGIT